MYVDVSPHPYTPAWRGDWKEEHRNFSSETRVLNIFFCLGGLYLD